MRDSILRTSQGMNLRWSWVHTLKLKTVKTSSATQPQRWNSKRTPNINPSKIFTEVNIKWRSKKTESQDPYSIPTSTLNAVLSQDLAASEAVVASSCPPSLRIKRCARTTLVIPVLMIPPASLKNKNVIQTDRTFSAAKVRDLNIYPSPD